MYIKKQLRPKYHHKPLNSSQGLFTCCRMITDDYMRLRVYMVLKIAYP
jgi:hypothetical protein